MKREPHLDQVPSSDDWGELPSDTTWEGLSLRSAYEDFGGKTIEEVKEFLAGDPGTVFDSFRYMPDVPFRYYIFAYLLFLNDSDQIGGYDGPQFAFLCALRQKLMEQPEAILPVIEPLYRQAVELLSKPQYSYQLRQTLEFVQTFKKLIDKRLNSDRITAKIPIPDIDESLLLDEADRTEKELKGEYFKLHAYPCGKSSIEELPGQEVHLKFEFTDDPKSSIVQGRNNYLVSRTLAQKIRDIGATGALIDSEHLEVIGNELFPEVFDIDFSSWEWLQITGVPAVDDLAENKSDLVVSKRIAELILKTSEERVYTEPLDPNEDPEEKYREIVERCRRELNLPEPVFQTTHFEFPFWLLISTIRKND